MKHTKLLSMALVLALMLSVVATVPFGVSAETTYSKVSSYNYENGKATYTKYSLTGNNGITVDANVLEVSPDDYMVMVYSGYAASAALLEKQYQRAVADGYEVVAMINGSFFSMDSADGGFGCYGRLVEYDVVNGELYSGDAGNAADSYDGAVCILSDGTITSVPNTELAFHLSFNGVEIPNSLGTVNKTGGSKLNDKGVDNWSNMFYYFDSHVGGNAPTYGTLTGGGKTVELAGYEIVCQKASNTGLRIGGTQYGTIKEIKKGGYGSVIADDEFVLFVRAGSPFVENCKTLKVGDEVSVAVDEKVAAAAPITEKANSIIENVNYWVKDGVNLTENASKFNKTAAHSLKTGAMWSAIGIKEDGSYVFFTCTGASTGASGNVLQSDAANMLAALGCKTVIRMDGGGSSAMYLADNGTGVAGYKQNQGRAVADTLMIVKKSSPALNGNAQSELEALVAKYENKTEKAYVDALASANSVLASSTSVSGDYKRAQMTIEQVVYAYDKLDAAVEAAEKADRGKYAPTPWANLQAALAAARNTSNCSPKEISDIVASLLTAVGTIGEYNCNVALNKPYTSTKRNSSNTWADTNGKELTDGILGNPAEAGGTAWSGYSANFTDEKTPSIVVDLGEVMTGLTGFAMQFLNMKDWGITVPDQLRISVSDDGENFTVVGTQKSGLSAADKNADGLGCTITLNVPEGVSGRYVKFEFDPYYGWAFMGEVMVYQMQQPYGGPLYQPGDANMDGVLDGFDYFLIKSHCLGMTTLMGDAMKYADVNGDGTVDGWDYFKVKSIILGME